VDDSKLIKTNGSISNQEKNQTYNRIYYLRIPKINLNVVAVVVDDEERIVDWCR